MAELQIRSAALRRASPSTATPDPMLGFGLMPDTAVTQPSMGESERTEWRQTDLTRAIRAAEKAALRSYRIEIALDGTISIVVGAETAASLPPCGETLSTQR